MSGVVNLHGGVFAYHGTGCLLLGESGTGKSKLISEALLFGAKLVADDQVQLSLLSGMLTAAPPANLAGVMELPGFGLLRIPDYNNRQVINLAVELTTAAATSRLPAPETKEFLGIKVPLLRLPPAPPTSVSGLLLYMKAMQEGRILPQDWMPQRKGA